MSIKSNSTSELLKSMASQDEFTLPDKYRKMLVDLLKYYYDKGMCEDEDIAVAVQAGNILPEDYTYITGKPYPDASNSSNSSGSSTPSTPSNSSNGSTGSNGSAGSNPSK